MMLPIEESVLLSNPKFAALHKTLTTSILNLNGSTKNHPSQLERDARAEELRAHRFRATKSTILLNALSTLPLSTSPPSAPVSKSSTSKAAPKTSLPPELIELIMLLTLHLNNPKPHHNSPFSSSSSSNLTILHTFPFNTIHAHIPTISSLLSSHIHTHALALTRLLNPTTNASFLHRQIPTLPSTLTTLQRTIASSRHTLQSSRANLIPVTTTLLTSYTTAISLVITHLEQLTHGQVSRSVRAHSELLSLSSQTLAAETGIKHSDALAKMYTPEAKIALRAYGEHLRDARARLRQRRRDAEMELGRYGVGREGGRGGGGGDGRDGEDGGGASKEKVMREIARVWGELEGRVREARGDLERLRGR